MATAVVARAIAQAVVAAMEEVSLMDHCGVQGGQSTPPQVGALQVEFA